MGYAERENIATRIASAKAAQADAQSLAGLTVVLDVQHIYRTGAHAGDRGTRYTLTNGTHIWEAAIATAYAAAAGNWLRVRGARVSTNDPVRSILTGPYSVRNRFAVALKADAYLACHVNAGDGSYGLLEWMDGGVGVSLASSIAKELQTLPEIRATKVNMLHRGDRGAVCIEATVPAAPRVPAVSAVIVEPFFGDNPRQQALIEPPRLVELGATIGRGVADWWEARRGAPSQPPKA
jgi:N-acetylmuramoyl-L-alanine amidase